MSTVPTNDETRRNICANLQRILEDRGISYTSLAEMTGDSLMTISRTCRGLHVPGAGVIARIAEALDVSVDRLVSTPPEKIPSTSS